MTVPQVTPFSTTPNRQTGRETFSADTDTYHSELSSRVSQMNTQADFTNTKATEAAASATASAGSATSAANSATAAASSATAAAGSATAAAISEANAGVAGAAASGATQWAAGSYTAGDAVYSPIDFQTYRARTTHTGATDPSADSANWARVTFVPAYRFLSNTATAILFDRIAADVSGGAWTLSLPATATAGDWVRVTVHNGDAGVNNLTVAGNGNTINGDASLVVDLSNVETTLAFSGSEWRVM